LIKVSPALDYTNSVRNIQGIIILAQSHVALLQSPWGNQSIDLFAFNVVQIPHGSLDLTLVGLDVHDKYKGVGVFNELHRRLGCEGVLDDGVLVEARLFRGGLLLVLGLSVQRKSLGAVEVNLRVNTSSLLGNTLLQGF
jgi:hypothetical protein